LRQVLSAADFEIMELAGFESFCLGGSMEKLNPNAQLFNNFLDVLLHD